MRESMVKAREGKRTPGQEIMRKTQRKSARWLTKGAQHVSLNIKGLKEQQQQKISYFTGVLKAEFQSA